ncbi:lipopolysaccharide biosynthesis protein [Flavobacterium acetivorans]|uniref:lipopolysaccharide biosynthesis protein n=1 Tax=Flavobacterium acetivorans TaxID=2893883 RepID=UPI001E2D935F|nr:lipopolysaccharide biosynthesis protein [Flavobacterium sp. F-29]UFH35770.1 lipopolysaccharide biosynthesis protein [Flavobacterium sp. F-29]
MSQNDIGKLTLIGVGWSFVEKFIGYFIQFLFTILLARLLVPEDFGLVGLLVVFTAVSQVFIDSGFTQTLIQNKSLDNKDYSSVFYFNVVIAVFIYLVLFFLAPYIADYYKDERLIDIARVSFITLIVNSFSIVPNAIIQKEMDFKILAKRTLIANILAGIVAVFFAFYGAGVWSLALQILLSSIFKTLLLWFSIKWRPLRYFSLEPIKILYKFSLNIMFSSLLDTLVSNAPVLIIGKYYNKTTLGYFSQSYNLQSIPSNALVAVIRNVTFSAMSKIQDDDNRLNGYFLETQNIAFYIIFNSFVFLSISSNEFVRLLLGSNWIQTIEYFKYLCFVGAFLPVYNLGMNILLVKKKGRDYLVTNIYKRIVTIVLVLSTITFSIRILIFGQIAAVIINSFITMYMTQKTISLSMLNQLKGLYKSFLIGVLIYMFFFFIEKYISFGLIVNLILKVFLFLILFLLLSHLTKHTVFTTFLKKVKR